MIMNRLWTECVKRGCMLTRQSIVSGRKNKYMVLVPGGYKFLVGHCINDNATEVLLAVIDRLLEHRDALMRKKVSEKWRQ